MPGCPTEAQVHKVAEELNKEAAEHEYPQKMKEEILVGCRAYGDTSENCHCVLEKLETRYSIAEVEAINEALKDDIKPPESFRNISEGCAS